jgi:hypothetical protein
MGRISDDGKMECKRLAQSLGFVANARVRGIERVLTVRVSYPRDVNWRRWFPSWRAAHAFLLNVQAAFGEREGEDDPGKPHYPWTRHERIWEGKCASCGAPVNPRNGANLALASE